MEDEDTMEDEDCRSTMEDEDCRSTMEDEDCRLAMENGGSGRPNGRW